MAKRNFEALQEAGVYLKEGEAVKDIRLFLNKCRKRTGEEADVRDGTGGWTNGMQAQADWEEAHDK